MDDAKLPPHSPEAEMCVIGSILIDSRKVIPKVNRILKPDDFYFPRFQVIMEAALDCFTRHTLVDRVTLLDMLPKNEGYDLYLMECQETVVSVTRVEHYAKIVKKHSQLRKMTAISIRTEAAIEEGGDDAQAIANEAISEMMLLFRNGAHKPKRLGEIMSETIEYMDSGFGEGIPTGFVNIDKVIGGLRNSEYIVIAGRPSQGKTALAWDMAVNVATRGIPVGFISYEMSSINLGMRVMKRHPSGLELTKLSDIPLYVNDSSGRTVVQLISNVFELYHERECRVFFIDYLQLMHGNKESRNMDLTIISASIKDLAKELDVPLVVLSQLSREVEKRADKRPIMADLRDSGSIEQDADLIMFVYREAQYRKNDPEVDQTLAEILIEKQRNGETGKALLNFSKEVTKFSDRDPYHQEPQENGKAREAARRTEQQLGESEYQEDNDPLPF